jgi:leucyl aminopeptidase
MLSTIWRSARRAPVTGTHGDGLLDANLPLIHTVGRASDEDPRLIDMTWGSDGPLLTLVGKGVCFDTGGSEPQARRVDGADEKGHGRGSQRAGPCAHDHGRGAAR